jgi:hypothetical protein
MIKKQFIRSPPNQEYLLRLSRSSCSLGPPSPSPRPSAYVPLRVRECIWSMVRTRRWRERVILGLWRWSVIRLGGANDVWPGAAALQLRQTDGAAVPVRHTEQTTVCRSSHRPRMLSIAHLPHSAHKSHFLLRNIY